MPVKFKHMDSGEVETTESFFFNQFMNARIDKGEDSNVGYDPILEESRDDEWLERHWKEIKANEMKYEEDVNQYITLVLAELVNPQAMALANKYLVNLKSDAGQIATEMEERSKKYFVYKVNADFLLLNLGLFNPDTNLLGTAYFDKGESYYFSAATSLKAIRGGRSGQSDVLEKLSLKFGKYVEILRHMKNSADNYLSFHFKIPPLEMKQMEATLTEEVQKRKPSSP